MNPLPFRTFYELQEAGAYVDVSSGDGSGSWIVRVDVPGDTVPAGFGDAPLPHITYAWPRHRRLRLPEDHARVYATLVRVLSTDWHSPTRCLEEIVRAYGVPTEDDPKQAPDVFEFADYDSYSYWRVYRGSETDDFAPLLDRIRALRLCPCWHCPMPWLALATLAEDPMWLMTVNANWTVDLVSVLRIPQVRAPDSGHPPAYLCVMQYNDTVPERAVWKQYARDLSADMLHELAQHWPHLRMCVDESPPPFVYEDRRVLYVDPIPVCWKGRVKCRTFHASSAAEIVKEFRHEYGEP